MSNGKELIDRPWDEYPLGTKANASCGGYWVKEPSAGELLAPTLQTRFGKTGNCLAACMSTLYGIDIGSIPDFGTENGEEWCLEFSEWMSDNFGKFVIPVKLADKNDVSVFCSSLVVATIVSDNTDPEVHRHAVITQKGRIIFDPMVGEVDRPLPQKLDPTFLVVSDLKR